MYTDFVRRAFAIAFVILMAFSAATPLLACAVGDRHVVPAPRCCEHKAPRCGSPDARASNSCCRAKAIPANTMAVTSEHRPVPAPVQHAIPSPILTTQTSWQSFSEEQDHPPGEILTDICVLKI